MRSGDNLTHVLNQVVSLLYFENELQTKLGKKDAIIQQVFLLRHY